MRELVERHPIALVNSVNPFRVEGQKTGAFEVCDELARHPTCSASRSATPGNDDRWWKGFQEY